MGTTCGCGQHHDNHHHHEHHDHRNHEHHHGCGCAAQKPSFEGTISGLSGEEKEMLSLVYQFGQLPVTRFVLKNSREDDIISIALSPVAIEETDDSMQRVKARGAVLTSLSDKGLIVLDYDTPLPGYDYDGYKNSELFAYFKQTVAQAQGQSGFLFDTAGLEMGTMAVTELGASLFA